MMQTLFENYGTLLEFDKKKLWSFWNPENLEQDSREQELRDLKLGYRAKSIVKISKQFAESKIDEQKLRTKTKLEQEEFLLSLYGIGPASVGYIMFEGFHHWDFLRKISPWEQKIYTQLFWGQNWKEGLVEIETMQKYFEKWGKYKMLAVHYIWENLWWKRKNEHIHWLEELIRL